MKVNIPIQLCQEQGFFSKYGVEVDYTTVLEGTGAMLKRLHHNGIIWNEMTYPNYSQNLYVICYRGRLGDYGDRWVHRGTGSWV